MIKLDVKDRKILYELDKNSRQSFSNIAKSVRLSQETVRYRINSLIKNGVINKFFTVTDTAKLGLAHYKVLLRLHNVNEQKIQEIINYLKENNAIVWLVTLDGNYDIGFVAKVANIVELSRIIDDINIKYNEFIHKRVISTNIIGEYLIRDYLVDKQRELKKDVSYTAEFLPYELDSTNKDIIKLLSANSRISAVEIAIKLKISADAILSRLKKLEQDKVVTRYNIVLNHDKINQIHYKILIFLNNVSREKIQTFLTYCRKNNRIVYIIKTLGQWDYELDIEVENVEQFRKIMLDLTREFSEIINDFNVLIINKIHKYNLYP